jgi:hypothetical protein
MEMFGVSLSLARWMQSNEFKFTERHAVFDCETGHYYDPSIFVDQENETHVKMQLIMMRKNMSQLNQDMIPESKCDERVLEWSEARNFKDMFLIFGEGEINPLDFVG